MDFSYLGLTFVNALFQYSNTVATNIVQIANFFVSGPAQFYKLATIVNTTISIPLTELVNLIELPTLQIALWYANIGDAMKTFGNALK